ncbi:Uncharacterised protein [Mycobacteroides abscessus subsp. abscessus]|nr:Uncharacterised protein [Mycobacteroides abscessus subsp. abscessus]
MLAQSRQGLLQVSRRGLRFHPAHAHQGPPQLPRARCGQGPPVRRRVGVQQPHRTDSRATLPFGQARQVHRGHSADGPSGQIRAVGGDLAQQRQLLGGQLLQVRRLRSLRVGELRGLQRPHGAGRAQGGQQPRVAPAETPGRGQQHQGCCGRVRAAAQQQRRRQIRPETGARFLPQGRGQCGRGRVGEDLRQGAGQAQPLVDPGHQLQRGQGRAPGREEVRAGPQRLALEHLPEQLSQDRLPPGGRAALPSWGAVLPRGLGDLPFGQRPAVRLAVGGDRQALQHLPDRGHHVPGQVPFGVVPGPLHDPVLLRCGLQEADEHLLRPDPAHQGDGGAHPGHRGQHGLHLAQLQALPADLDLVVRASPVLQGPVRAPPGQIPRAVDPHPLRALVPEPSGRQVPERGGVGLGAVQVSGSDLHPRQAQVPHDPDRAAVPARVQDVHPGVPGGPADGHHGLLRVLLGGPGGDVHGGLRGAVEVQRPGAEHPAAPGHLLPGQGLPAAHHGARPVRPGRERPGRPRGSQERREHRGHEVQAVHPGLGDQPGQVLRVLMPLGGRHDDAGPVSQRPVQLPHVHVEGDGRLVRHPVPRTHGSQVLLPGQPVVDPCVGDGHALGTPGGPGGEQDIGEVLRGAPGAGQRVLEACGCGLLSAHPLLGPGQVRSGQRGHRVLGHRVLGGRGTQLQRVQARALQQPGAACVGEHPGDPFGRQLRVHRQIDRTRREQGVHADVLVQAAVGAQGHRVPGGHAQARQGRGAGARGLGQLGVGQAPTAEPLPGARVGRALDHGGLLRVLGHGGREALPQGSGAPRHPGLRQLVQPG